MGNRIEAGEAAKTRKRQGLQPLDGFSIERGQLNSKVESRT